MLVDANILLYASDESSRFHDSARSWLTSALNGPRRVGIPWMSLIAYMRIATNPRATRHPLTPQEAWHDLESWMDAPTAWIPTPGPGHREILSALLVGYDIRAGLMTDAVLAAMCIEHGLAIVSADTDFARFTEVTWINPVA